MLACTLVHAAGQTPTDETSAEKLTRIEAETAVLKARERAVEVEAQIAAKHVEIATKRAESERIGAAAMIQQPILRGIDGVGGRLYATLELPRRGTIDVTDGDTLSDGTRVISVHPREVILRMPNAQRLTLTGPVSATAETAGYADGAALAALPPLPTMYAGTGAAPAQTVPLPRGGNR
jgi:type IV pilus biogenesis protein PilP